MRTCRGCRGKFEKGALLRFTLDDGVPVAGKGPGRGYYVCANAACIEKALGRRNLSRLTGRSIGEEDAERLRHALLEPE